MKIIKEHIDNNIESIEIISAQYIEGYSIKLIFSDGFNRVVNFKSFLEHSLHPSIRKYLNMEKFRNFKIIDGNINWNDYDMIFPIWDLHEGKI